METTIINSHQIHILIDYLRYLYKNTGLPTKYYAEKLRLNKEQTKKVIKQVNKKEYINAALLILQYKYPRILIYRKRWKTLETLDNFKDTYDKRRTE